jgi:quinol monooxygenase YgiN
MSSLSVIIAGLGAVAAAVGCGVLLARCFRAPRADLVAWSVALIGLLISLGAQTLGYLSGFGASTFRAMELGGQVVAPLALILGLTEVASRGLAGRFCARVYIPALALVSLVVLTLDELQVKTFTKAWPDPALYYQAPPDYVLMFAVAPVTAAITVLTVGLVVFRSGTPGWNAVLPAQLAAGAAALLLAYPGLVQLAKYEAGISLPIRSEFTLCCAAAAALTLFAGVRISRLDVGRLHRGGAAAARGGREAGGVRPDDYRQRDGYGGGGYGGAGGYGREPDEAAGRGGRDRDGYAERRGPGDYGRAAVIDQTGDFEAYDPGYAPDGRGGDGFARDGIVRDGIVRDGYGDEFETGDHDLGDGAAWVGREDQDGYEDGRYPADAYRDGQARDDRSDPEPHGYGRPREGWQDELDGPEPAAGGRAGGRDSRAELFGQIAIYTLLEDRVDEFDQLTEQVVADVRSREPDTLVYIVHAVPSAPMQRILYEVYRDRAAYDRHLRQPYVEQFESDRRPYVLATNVIELGLQQAKVSPFPSVADLFGEPGYDTSGFERPDYLRDYGRPAAGQGGEPRGRRGR